MDKIEDIFDSVEKLNDYFRTTKNRSVILFADLSNSTLFKQQRSFVNGLYKTKIHNSSITKIAIEYGGQVIKYIGDATMCEFVCTDSVNIIHNAINAAIKIIEYFNKYNSGIQDDMEKIQTKIGIAYGTVAYFYKNDPQGRVVDLAARIEGTAKPNQILIHKDVMDACDLSQVYSELGKANGYKPGDYFSPPINLRLKGIPEPQEIVEVKTESYFKGIEKDSKHIEHWKNYRFEAYLSQMDEDYINNKYICDNYFKLVYDLRYETVLNRTQFKFVCTTNMDQFNRAMNDASLFSRYNLPKNKNIVENIKILYKAESVIINKTQLTEIEAPSSSPYYLMQCFSDSCLEELQGDTVSIRYRISTIINKYAHFYFMTTEYPIQNLSMVFKIGDTDIDRFWVVTHFSPDSVPTITYTPPDPATAKEIEVSIGKSESIDPGNGVTFVWKLKSEGASKGAAAILSPDFSKPDNDSDVNKVMGSIVYNQGIGSISGTGNQFKFNNKTGELTQTNNYSTTMESSVLEYLPKIEQLIQNDKNLNEQFEALKKELKTSPPQKDRKVFWEGAFSFGKNAAEIVAIIAKIFAIRI